MALSLVTAPLTEPLSIDDAKLHLRVENTDEDPLIESLIAAARETAEAFTRRAFVTQTWDLKLDGFCNVIQIPLPPLQSLTSLTYTDSGGTTQTLWDTAAMVPTTPAPNYVVDTPTGPYADPGRVTPAYGLIWPIPQQTLNAITLRFVAGYGDAGDVPETIKAAMKLIVGHLYANRENVVITDRGSIVQEMPQAAEYLLWPYRNLTF